MNLLTKSFYLNDNVLECAKNLLGKLIVHKHKSGTYQCRIVETEAYDAPDDRANHGFQLRKTPRNLTMFREGGVSYVYLCYGVHRLFNVVTGPEGMPYAVLVRGVTPVSDTQALSYNRGFEKFTPTVLNGPGKLTVAMQIEKADDGICLYDTTSKIGIYHDGFELKSENIYVGPRVGVGGAKEAAHYPYRYYIKGNKFVSKPLVAKYS